MNAPMRPRGGPRQPRHKPIRRCIGDDVGDRARHQQLAVGTVCRRAIVQGEPERGGVPRYRSADPLAARQLRDVDHVEPQVPVGELNDAVEPDSALLVEQALHRCSQGLLAA